MKIIALIAPATWPAVVDAAKRHEAADVTLVATAEPLAPLVGPPGGLMGRERPPEPAPHLAESAATDLLTQASAALGRAVTTQVLQGPAERSVVQVCAGADVLILARDGDNTRLGPASLAHQTRFIVDHAPCAVELVWPTPPPSVATIPPPPGH